MGDDIRQQQLFWIKVCAGALIVLVIVVTVAVLLTLPRLAVISNAVKSIDWATLSGSVNELVNDTQTSMQKAAEALDALDFETLNKAISDLQKVVEPLANLIGRFG